MLRFLAIRIASAIPVLFVMSIITYGIIQAPPGDYADYVEGMLLYNNASQEVAHAAAEQFRLDHGLNDPLVIQYFRWIKGFFVGDFGHCMLSLQPHSWISSGSRTSNAQSRSRLDHEYRIIGEFNGAWSRAYCLQHGHGGRHPNDPRT